MVIAKRHEWAVALLQLRELLLDLGLEETVKWASPVYMFEGKNVVGLAGFKGYYGLWFHQGALLFDPECRLVNAQAGWSRAMRQLRFASLEELDLDLARRFVKEAIANESAAQGAETLGSVPAKLLQSSPGFA